MLGGVRTVIVDEIHARSAIARQPSRADPRTPWRHCASAARARQSRRRNRSTRSRFLVGASHVDRDGVPDCTIVDSATCARAISPSIAAGACSKRSCRARPGTGPRPSRRARRGASHDPRLRQQRRMTNASPVISASGSARSTSAKRTTARWLGAAPRRRATPRGELKVLVATASLELASTSATSTSSASSDHRTRSAFQQRVGRSGHVSGRPEGPPVPAVARRSRRMRGPARCGASRRTRPLEVPDAPL